MFSIWTQIGNGLLVFMNLVILALIIIFIVWLVIKIIKYINGLEKNCGDCKNYEKRGGKDTIRNDGGVRPPEDKE